MPGMSSLNWNFSLYPLLALFSGGLRLHILGRMDGEGGQGILPL